jgi:hypothetical protein
LIGALFAAIHFTQTPETEPKPVTQ